MSNYTALSFEGIVDKLKDYLEQKDTWKDVTESSTGTTFIELASFAVATLEYYLQRTFEERFTDSAQFWESLVRIGALINYKVKRPVGSIGTLKLYPGTSETTIPKGYPFTINGMDFYIAETVTVKDEPVEVTVRQGTAFTKTFSGPYTEFMEIEIGDEWVTDTDLEVYVGANQWQEVDYIIAASDCCSYELFTDIDKTLKLRFGTEKVGGLPHATETLTVKGYRVLGRDGNYYGTDVEIGGTFPNSVTAELITPLTGGDNIETVEELRLNIPSEYRTRVGLISLADYYEFVRSLPGVRKVYVRDVKDSMDVPFRTVSIYVIPEGGYELSEAQKNEIDKHLRVKTVVGVKYEIKQPLFREVDVTVNCKGKSGYNKLTVENNVREAIQKLYDIDNLEFGQWITISDIYNTVMATQGVFQCTVLAPHYNISTMKDWEFLKLRNLEVVVF